MTDDPDAPVPVKLPDLSWVPLDLLPAFSREDEGPGFGSSI